MNIRFLITIILISFAYSADRPKWINEHPSGYQNDYFVGVGRSKISESDARNIALANALLRIVQNGSIKVKAIQEIKTQSTEIFKNGESLSLESVDDIVNDIRVDGESQSIKGLREEEYFTEESSGNYVVWSLVKIPKKNPTRALPPTRVDAVWRSTIIPSWGQFYKKDYTKGYFIAGGTAVFLTSGFVFSNLKITAESDAINSRTQLLRDYYNDNANTYNNISLACFIVTTAIYVYNVVDAIATDGEKIYVINVHSKHYEHELAQNKLPKPQSILTINIDL
ncbi:MAG: hypothetical protein WCW35_10190 [Bacteroidota bacterium]|jgi:hypothetical protein